ncbi:MAG TPA: S41 family peptidase [Thermoanaerobaculia bacterium]|nr:S41 family peptidase [Thermoanaerobaculia bacterium]
MLATALVGIILGLATATPEPARECGCLTALDFLSGQLERNYAGFHDKVTPETRAGYDGLVQRLREQARITAEGADCEALLREWTGFFKDGHMQVAAQPAGGAAPPGEEDPAAIRARFASWDKVALTEEAARKSFAEKGAALDPIEGIWEVVPNSRYRMAILRSPTPQRDFVAVILAADGVWWTPGQVKATYTAAGPGRYESRFYYRDHSERTFTTRVDRNLLFHEKGKEKGPLLVKVYPEVPGAVDAAAYQASLNTEVRLKELDSRTLLLQLPSFAPINGAAIAKAIEDNRDKLLKTPNLIIDLRGNGGGSDHTFQPLLPFLYTGPVRVGGFDLYATEDNARLFDEMAADPNRPEENKASLRKTAAELRANLGKFLTGEDGTLELDTVHPNPRRVAVLVDRGCMSSCEGLVDIARQSKKVTVFGENTGGAFDYGNINVVRTPCQDYAMAYGTARKRGRQGSVDLHGMAPDVRVPEGEIFPVEWVRQSLEKEEGKPPAAQQ